VIKELSDYDKTRQDKIHVLFEMLVKENIFLSEKNKKLYRLLLLLLKRKKRLMNLLC
jgi:hypothetical protein